MKSKLCSFDDVRALCVPTVISSVHRRQIGLRRFLSGWLVLAVTAFGLSATAVHAKEKKDLDISLTAQHVVRDASGAETLLNDVAVNPGELVQYTAVYRNLTVQPLRKLAPTIPIPSGMEFVASSASPAPAFASLDGKTFEPYPISRPHTLPDGRLVFTEVNASAYRVLRWAAGDLSPASELTVAIRARVSGETVAAR